MVTTYMPLAISQRFVKREFDDTTRHKVKTVLIFQTELFSAFFFFFFFLKIRQIIPLTVYLAKIQTFSENTP